MQAFDLTPDPKLLLALTHTPLKPLDALSELLDNALDSFTLARNQGRSIRHPLVVIHLPSSAELHRGEGVLSVRDNGVGMSPEMAEQALKAGFSGNNPYDSLGLFGMGLNIATGKLARRTTLLTAQKEDSHAIKAVVDLVKIGESHSYEVVPEEVDKPQDFEHGTLIEASGWWPEGNPNFGFIRKLVSYGRPRVRREIGRRYATVLHGKETRLLVDNEACHPFEHCVWGDTRFVERRDHGKIYAVRRFSETVGSQTRCTQCYALIPQGESSCPVCGESALRTIEEKVRGWVGIQRYDDASHFGIDLIRNGRAIRLLDKSGFFEFTDEFGNVLKDYPADSPYGRIVGEVHLDHVPVDFMKQDFQRTSPEWQRAVTYLRGDSSLQPTQQGAENNRTPVFMLYQGYRRVRRYGKRDMYMGSWDEQADRPKRIDRKTERDYLAKFEERVPGYYDDAEWWKLVERADTRPVENLVECNACGADNLESAEICQVCTAILKGKQCVECCKKIALSEANCPHCGSSQIPEVEEPWSCQVCRKENQPTVENCVFCDAVRGTQNPLSPDYLRENSVRDGDLSISGCSVKLADGSHSQAMDVDCYITLKPILPSKGERVPAVIHKGERIEVFVDKQHPMYTTLGVSPEETVASEIAYYIHVLNARLSGSPHHAAHTPTNLQWALLDKYWSATLSDSQDGVRQDVIAFFTEVAERLGGILGEAAADIFDELSETDVDLLVANIRRAGGDITSLGEMKTSGRYLCHLGAPTVVDLFRKHAALFFDGALWSQPYATVPDIPEAVMNQVRDQTRRVYLNCLEDCLNYIDLKKPDTISLRRTRSSLQYLQRELED